MPVAVPRVAAYERELDDVTVALPRIRLQRIKRDCMDDLARASDPGLMAVLHGALGLVEARLGNLESALSHFRAAATLDKAAVVPLINQASVHLLDNQPEPALHALDEARRRPNGDHFLVWTARSWALSLLGRQAEANEAFRTAVRHSDLASDVQVFRLASQAAQIGDHIQAVELLARFFALRYAVSVGPSGVWSFLESVPSDWWSGIHLNEALQRSLAAVNDDPVARALVSAPADDEDDEPETDDADGLVSDDEVERLFSAP